MFIQLIGSSVLTSQCFGEGWKYVRIGHARVSRVSSVQMSYAWSFGRSVRAYARVWKRKGQMYYCLPPGPRYPRLTHPEWEGTGPTQRYFGDTYLPVTFGFPSGSSEPRRIYFTARPVIRHCTTHVFPTFVPWRINNH